MARTKTVHRCTDCGATSPSWVGRCPGCGAWSTLVEHVEAPSSTASAPAWAGWGSDAPAAPAQPITACVELGVRPRPTGLGELDRVLGGGVVPGSVTLVGGAPGTGKSTLVLQAAAGLAEAGARVLYACAEESPAQVRARGQRVGVLHDDLWLVGESLLPRILATVDELSPDVLVVDSAQSVADPESSGAGPGSMTQVRDVSQRLVREAKARSMAVLVVGHVTKDGALAGPRALEHVVDTVLELEGDRHHALRVLRAVKHRFGSTAEVGLFELGEAGLAGVADPSAGFLADRLAGSPGSVVVPTLDGTRPLMVEIQALTSTSTLPEPRRTGQGLDRGRLTMLLAVLQAYTGTDLGRADVFVSAAGGVRVTEPGADLAVALAVVSSAVGRPVPEHLVVCGEIGLSGELRHVLGLERRLLEAARLGFREAVVPASAPEAPEGIIARRARSLHEALLLALSID